MAERIVIAPISLQLREVYRFKIKMPQYRCIRKIDIYGKISYNNMPVNGAAVVLFRVIGDKKIPIKQCITDKNGYYYFEMDKYYEDIIGITSFRRNKSDLKRRVLRAVRYNIKVDPINDIILYGKVVDSHGEPINGAIVAAFYEDENEMHSICHTFTDIDGVYMLGIKYDLYKDKKIVVKSVKSSYSIISNGDCANSEEDKDEY